jgi:AcrR family transcriptional regulator
MKGRGMMEGARQKTLAETKVQFLERGPGGTSLDSVLEATGMTEAEFHEHFESIEDVAWTLLQDYAKGEFGIIARIAGQAEQATDNLAEKSLAFFKLFYEDFLMDWYEVNQVPPTGDLFSVFVYGRGAVSEQIYSFAAESLAQWVETFEGLIQPLLDTAQVPHEATARELANMMVSINLGAIILGRATDDAFLLSRQQRLFSDYLRSLVS